MGTEGLSGRLGIERGMTPRAEELKWQAPKIAEIAFSFGTQSISSTSWLYPRRIFGSCSIHTFGARFSIYLYHFTHNTHHFLDPFHTKTISTSEIDHKVLKINKNLGWHDPDMIAKLFGSYTESNPYTFLRLKTLHRQNNMLFSDNQALWRNGNIIGQYVPDYQCGSEISRDARQ
jgi:hypothetical protein